MNDSSTQKILEMARHPQLNRLTTPLGGEYSQREFECQPWKREESEQWGVSWREWPVVSGEIKEGRV